MRPGTRNWKAASRVRKSAGRDVEERQLNANDVFKRLRGTGRSVPRTVPNRRFLADEGFNPSAQVHFFDHHATHAAAAAFYSGFPDAAVLTLHGKGDLESTIPPARSPRVGSPGCELSDALGTSAGEFYDEITVQQLGFPLAPARGRGQQSLD